jgi:Helix-turn-helix family
MTASARDRRRDLVDLLPQFLTRRMRGWDGLQPLLGERGIARPDAVLLRAVVMETEPGAAMTEAELRANLFNPYGTVSPIFEVLPALVERGCLARHGQQYIATPEGRALIERIERAGRAYLATLDLLAPADAERLADTFAEIASRLWAAPEPVVKAHQAHVRRLPPTVGEPSLARLDLAVYALWMARDDAHIAAWRHEGFDGPTFELLSQIWSGAASTRSALNERVGQRPEDITRGLAALSERGYAIVEGDALRLTAAGQATRDAIETETDRIYFTPWPALAPDEIAWLCEAFRALCERLA